MLDIKFIRENLDLVKLAAQKKKSSVDLDRLAVVDDSRREIMQRMEEKKAEQNRVSEGIPRAAGDEVARQELITQMQALKAEIQKDEEALKPVMEEWQALMLQVCTPYTLTSQ